MLDTRLRNLQPHGLPSPARAVEPDPARQPVARAAGELHVVAANEGLRHLHQQHAAGETSVVPPVGVERRHSLAQPAVVDLHHQEIVRLPYPVGDLEVERRESALVLAELLAVEIDPGAVVGGPEVDEQP